MNQETAVYFALSLPWTLVVALIFVFLEVSVGNRGRSLKPWVLVSLVILAGPMGWIAAMAIIISGGIQKLLRKYKVMDKISNAISDRVQ